MKKDNPLVSICLAAFNGEDYIRQAVDSVLTQTFKDFELIISDDGSTDNTEKICREYANKDSRVRYIRHDVNRGGFWNNNYLLREAWGQYITLLSQDDAMDARFLEETVNYLSRHNECLLVSNDFELIDQSGKVLEIKKLGRLRDNISWQERSREFFRYPVTQVPFCLYGLMRGEVAKYIYPSIKFSNKMVRGSDLQLTSRVAAIGQIVSIPITLRKFRLHNQSAHQREKLYLLSRPSIVWRFKLLLNLYRIRFDLMRVLWSSNYPLPQKLLIAGKVHIGYARAFLTRLVRPLRKPAHYFVSKKAK